MGRIPYGRLDMAFNYAGGVLRCVPPRHSGHLAPLGTDIGDGCGLGNIHHCGPS